MPNTCPNTTINGDFKLQANVVHIHNFPFGLFKEAIGFDFLITKSGKDMVFIHELDAGRG